MKISTKLLVGFTVIIIILVLVLLVSTISNREVVAQADTVLAQTDASENELLEFRRYNELESGIKEMIQTVLNLGYVATIEEEKNIQEQYSSSVENVKESISGYENEETYFQTISQIDDYVKEVFDYKEAEILSQEDLERNQEKLKQYMAQKSVFNKKIQQMQEVNMSKIEKTMESFKLIKEEHADLKKPTDD